MKPKEAELCDQVKASLVKTLQQIPLDAKPADFTLSLEGRAADFVLRVSGSFGEKTLVGDFRRSGQPRFIRDGVEALRKYLGTLEGAYGVVTAPYISPDGAELCRLEGVGYADLAGNCRISFGTVHVERTGLPNPYAKDYRRELRSLYTPKCERVLRVLLEEPGRKWSTLPLAAAAGVSPALISKIRKALVNREWLGGGHGGFTLRSALPLLAEWAANYRWDRNAVGRYYSPEDSAAAERRLAERCAARGVHCCMTGFSAAARLAPMVNDGRTFAYVERGAAGIAEEAGLKPVPSGANVMLITPYDEGVFIGALEVDGATVASPYQTYLDLTALGGRGAEAAEAVLEQRIRPRW